MIRIIAVGFLGVLASASLRKINPNFSYIAAIATGVLIIGMLYLDIDNLINIIKTVSEGYGISDEYIKLLLKVIGISYITQFAASAADECGEKFIARKIEFAGRVFILTLTFPILVNLLNAILGIL